MLVKIQLMETSKKMPHFGDELRSIIMSIGHLIPTVIGPRQNHRQGKAGLEARAPFSPGIHRPVRGARRTEAAARLS
jgi:hypothetical protein